MKMYMAFTLIIALVTVTSATSGERSASLAV